MIARSARRKRVAAIIAALAAISGLCGRADARVILQYFESRWETIDHKMPDIFMSGYGTLYLPPPSRADSGNQSVGFDVFDRFDLGKENNETLYGTESSLRYLIKQAHRAGVLVYVDTVYNHNGFSDGYRANQSSDIGCAFRWEKNTGGYPGFIMNGSPFGLDYNLDFHNVCPSAQFPSPGCDGDPLNCRTSNLIDINQDSPSYWIRHPAFPNDTQNIPYQHVTLDNLCLYPDQELATFTNEFGEQIHPFNLASPENGDPNPEAVSNMLRRYTQWMTEVVGVDGFRLDAVKHTPSDWFVNVYDRAANMAAKDFWGRRTTPFSFGENVNSSWDALAPYHRKDFGRNRTVLDFPLKFSLQDNIGNDLQNILGASFDGYDGNGQDGSAGVMFVQSHDNGFIGDPPFLPNVAYAYILSRKGYPIVYYNAQEFGTGRDFPNTNSRGDALGVFGNTITGLVDINNELVNERGGNNFNDIWHDADVIAYELNNTAVVGICDRDDKGSNSDGYEERTVTLPGFRNVILKEVTGNSADSTVDPDNDILDTIAVPSNGVINLRIPTNRNDNNVAHGKSFVVYTIAPITGTMSVNNVAATLAPDLANPEAATATQRAKARLTPVDIVTANSVTVSLQVDQGGTLEDNALIKWNYGINIDGTNDPGNPYGLFLLDIPGSPFLNGYENYATKSPSLNSGGSHTGTGAYSVTVDLTDPAIPEGYNYLTSIAFVKRLDGLPALWQTFRKVIYVDRRAPDLDVIFPETQTGVNDIDGATFGFVVENPDATGNALHYFWNLPDGTNPVTSGLVNNSNKATKTDRTRYRFSLNNLMAGDNQKLTLVLYEETGTYALQTYNIGVSTTAATLSPTASPSPSPSISPTPTGSPSPSPSISATASPSPVDSPTPSLTPTLSPTLSPQPSPPPTLTPQVNPLGYVIN
ncbi:MAG: alpha-amylase family glycosyl hydrolase [Candidatus Sumerlaeota bacterium]